MSDRVCQCVPYDQWDLACEKYDRKCFILRLVEIALKSNRRNRRIPTHLGKEG